ncbi:radical SAM/SPASM domain-containing protein [Abyssisolibacter fermentans]|uniref:radical SAM/SPASM domain-containing protein n=1 Tax=Abyssisolibacter fermentans TaxID=1766203 RepID=UPI0008329BB1|nr:radical SAM protein [Abyssisolibacter fermentans]
MNNLYIKPINFIGKERDEINVNSDISVPEFSVIDYKSDMKIIFQKDSLKLLLVDQKTLSILEQLKNDKNYNIPLEQLASLLNNGLIIYKSESSQACKQDSSNNKLRKIFLHISHDCNLRCGYCYAEGGNYGGKSQLMSFETAVKAIEYVLSLDPEIKKLTIEFFGGEPFLNYKTIESMINYIEEEFPNINFEYGCVTNATIMNDEIENMLKKHKFHVMVTIDGPKDYHDLQRTYPDGTGSFETVLSNIPKFKKSANYLCARIVYTKKNIDLFKIFKYIYEELGIEDISYRPVMTDNLEYKIDEESENIAISTLCDCFDYFVEKKFGDMRIESKFFSEMLLNLIQRKVKKNFCDFGRFASITPEGDIYPCTHFVYNEQYKIGNIYKENIDKELINKCIESSKANYEPCKSCWILGLCAGGCKGSAAFYNNNEIFINDEYCNTRYKIAEKAMIKIADLYLEDKLEEITNKLIDAESQKISPNRWR